MKPQRGRPRSIFAPKEPKTRLQGILTKHGGQAFEQARTELRALAEQETGEKWPKVSDADTVEFLARGRLATLKYLQVNRP